MVIQLYHRCIHIFVIADGLETERAYSGFGAS